VEEQDNVSPFTTPMLKYKEATASITSTTSTLWESDILSLRGDTDRDHDQTSYDLSMTTEGGRGSIGIASPSQLQLDRYPTNTEYSMCTDVIMEHHEQFDGHHHGDHMNPDSLYNDNCSTPWGAITEIDEADDYSSHHYNGYDDVDGDAAEFYDKATYGNSVDSKYHYDRTDRDETIRNLVFGHARDCWRNFLQYDGFAFPDDLVLTTIIAYSSVSDRFDEYNTSLAMILCRQSLFHLKHYRSVEIVERTREWNRECVHSFGSDIWSRGSKTVWKMKMSGHETNAHKTCILIGIVEADRVSDITNYSGRDGGSFSDDQHGGYALLTGNWMTYHGDSDQGQLFRHGNLDEIDLSPNDVMSVEIDLTPKYRTGNSSKCGTLRFTLNGETTSFRNDGIAFDDIDIDRNYRLAIGMYLRDRVALYQIV